MEKTLTTLTTIANQCDIQGLTKLSKQIDNVTNQILTIYRNKITWEKFASNKTKTNLNKLHSYNYASAILSVLDLAQNAQKQGKTNISKQLYGTVNIMAEEGKTAGLWDTMRNVGRGVKRILGNHYEQILHQIEKLIRWVTQKQNEFANPATAQPIIQTTLSSIDDIRKKFVEIAPRTKDQDMYRLGRNYVQLVNTWDKRNPQQLIQLLQQAITNFGNLQPQQQQQPQQQTEVQQQQQVIMQKVISIIRNPNDTRRETLLQLLA